MRGPRPRHGRPGRARPDGDRAEHGADLLIALVRLPEARERKNPLLRRGTRATAADAPRLGAPAQTAPDNAGLMARPRRRPPSAGRGSGHRPSLPRGARGRAPPGLSATPPP